MQAAQFEGSLHLQAALVRIRRSVALDATAKRSRLSKTGDDDGRHRSEEIDGLASGWASPLLPRVGFMRLEGATGFW